MRVSATTEVTRTAGPPNTSYIVLDDDDRVLYVGADLSETAGRWIGHVLWDHLPKAAGVYGPCFEEARAKGYAVESTVFYSGRVKRLLAMPAADGLVVHVERLAELDVRTLGTLAASLRRIEAELAAQVSEPLDLPALASLQALP